MGKVAASPRGQLQPPDGAEGGLGRGSRRDWSRIALVAAAYFLAHHLAFFFPDAKNVLMLVWPAGGIGLAAFLLNRRRLWPAVAGALYVAGTLADVLLTNRSILAAFGFTAANVAESVGCASLILTASPDFRRFARVKEVTSLAVAALVVNAASACIGAGTSALTHGAPFVASWWSWYVADGLGLLLAGPLVVTWATWWRRRTAWNWSRAVEGLLCLASLTTLAWLIFVQRSQTGFELRPYMMAALLVWPAIRFGMRGMTVSLMLLFAIALHGASQSASPWVWAVSDHGPATRVLGIQAYVAVLAIAGYILAAGRTELQNTAESLKASEDRARSMLQTATDAVWLLDTAGVILEVNEAASLMLGYTRTELLGRRVADIDSAASDDRIRRRIDRVMSGGSHLFESEHRRKNGTSFPVEVSVAALPARQQMVAFIRDITERKRAEAALRTSEERLQLATRAGQVGIWDWEIENNRLTWDAQMHSLYGVAEHDLDGTYQSWRQAVHPADRDYVEGEIQAALRGEREYSPEFRILRPDGNVRVVQAASQTFRSNDGKPVRMIGTNIDITQRKQAEEQLRDNQALFSLFLQNSPIYAFIKQVTATESRVLQASDNFRDMIGTAGKDIVGKSMSELFPPEFADKITKDDIAVVSEGKNAIRIDEELNGRQYTTFKFPIVLGDRTLLAGYTVDITDRRRAEEERAKLQAQLLHAQKMESVGRLAGGVAHDFNNMLGVILGQTELALDEIGHDHPLVPQLELIRTVAERSADLTRQLLAFARKQPAKPRPLDLNQTVAGMLKMLGRLIGEDITLEWRPGNDLRKIQMDPSQLDQMLANLCVNSRDAIVGVGTIVIETGTRHLDEIAVAGHEGCAPADYAMLSVTDDGCGMSKEVLDRVFEPFFTSKEVGKGTGLGLATVYGIVQQNHGFITAESELGRGATFRIFLPQLAGEPAQDHIQTASGTRCGKGETIMLVEDEPMLLKLSQAALERLGFRVLAAGSPEEALALFEAQGASVDLLMTDIIMPNMNGRELHQRMCSLRPGLRCLFVSGYPADIIGPNDAEKPGEAFLAKPFRQGDLAAKLCELLGRIT